MRAPKLTMLPIQLASASLSATVKLQHRSPSSKGLQSVTQPPFSRFHQCFTCAFFVQNFGGQNFKPKSQLCNFWCQNFVQKNCKCKMLMKLTPSLPLSKEVPVKSMLKLFPMQMIQCMLRKTNKEKQIRSWLCPNKWGVSKFCLLQPYESPLTWQVFTPNCTGFPRYLR